jgi:hypothetical protein
VDIKRFDEEVNEATEVAHSIPFSFFQEVGMLHVSKFDEKLRAGTAFEASSKAQHICEEIFKFDPVTVTAVVRLVINSDTECTTGVTTCLKL